MRVKAEGRAAFFTTRNCFSILALKFNFRQQQKVLLVACWWGLVFKSKLLVGERAWGLGGEYVSFWVMFYAQTLAVCVEVRSASSLRLYYICDGPQWWNLYLRLLTNHLEVRGLILSYLSVPSSLRINWNCLYMTVPSRIFTLMLPCIVIDFFLITNQTH
jgi:hypothetical protein